MPIRTKERIRVTVTNGYGYVLGANGDGVTKTYNGEGYVLLLTATPIRKAKK
jgi:hypothetical protein